MQRLKLFTRLHSRISLDGVQFRSLATSSRGGRGRGSGSMSGGASEDGIDTPGNRKESDSDFLSKYLQDGAASDEQFLDRFFHDDAPQQRAPVRDMGRQPRFAGPARGGGRFGARGGGRGGSAGRFGQGRGGSAGRFGQGRGGSFVRGGRAGSGSMERPGWSQDQDEIPPDYVRDEEEDMKLKEALAQELEQKVKEEEKEKDEEEEEEEEEEVRSIYTGFIDPKYDDHLKLHKQQLKRLRYKDKIHMPVKFEDEDEDKTLEDLDKDSDDDNADRRGRRGAMDLRGRAVVASSDDEDAEEEDEVDEEEWEAISDMNTTELEKHLKHREHAKVLKKEYMARIDALGQKVSDQEEVRKVQDIILRKWRQHYNIPRLVTPLEKEEMWEKHKSDPQEWTVEKLAEKFNVCRARVHAILWLWDLRKQGGEVKSAEEETKEYLAGLAFDSNGETCVPAHMGEDKWVTPWTTRPNYKIMPEDWEGSVRSEEEAIEEASTKEEEMMLEELVRRIEFNKLKMAGFVKQHPHSRRRPPGGWTYLVEKLGPEGKRGKRGGFRFVATANGEHRNLNDFEKLMLKREAVRPRRRIL